MQREIRKLFLDMQDAASTIQTFTSGRTLDDFRSDRMMRLAVERGFEIVGEALTQIRKRDPKAAEQIGDWKAIIGFRNVLIHGYANLDPDRTWDTAIRNTPALLQDLDAVLSQP